MEDILEERFQRVETALNTLIDSITTYNPSVQAAQDLVVADDEFSKGLEQRIAISCFNATILS
jgi:predicted RNA-binding protein with PIN domain